jgi:catechol 2,3-dioxygenase-like lactoylglutathione lyase family enzyme
MNTTETYGLTHIAVAVKDIQRTAEFYQNIFGMEVMYNESGFLQLTTPGSHDILVFEEKPDVQIGKSGGIAHFGFRLRDPEGIRTITKKVKETGTRIVDEGEFLPGSPYIFFKDPDGYEVEVWYELLP